MGYAVELHIDPIGQNKIKKLGDLLLSHGIPNFTQAGLTPRIQLGVFEDIAEQSLINVIRTMANETKYISVFFPSIGILPSTNMLYISPVAEKTLLNFHEAFYTNNQHSLSGVEKRMLPGSYIPMVKLSENLSKEQMIKACTVLLPVWQAFKCNIEKIALIKTPPLYKEIEICSLQKILVM